MGLNAIFSNGDGFLRTFLFCGGITDEKAYKRFLPTPRSKRGLVQRLSSPDDEEPRTTPKSVKAVGPAQCGRHAGRGWHSGAGDRLPESGKVARLPRPRGWERLCRTCR